MNMVSAIITTHNRVDLLGRAIGSVLSQTYKDIELIVVSDGSTDGTDEFMRKYEGDNRINYISYHPGKGGNYARNTGVKAAKGEYVAFLDDDDEWLPTKIEEQVSVAQTDSRIGLVYTGINAIYINEGVSYTHTSEFNGDASHRILLSNFIGTTSTVMVKTEIVREAGLFDENLKALQDYDLWVRICQLVHVGYVNKPLINYYNETHSNQVSDKTELYEYCKDYIHSKYNLLFDALSKEEQDNLYVNDCFGLAKNCIRNGYRSKARSYLKKAIKRKISLKAVCLYLVSFVPFKYILRINRLSK